MDRLSWEEYFMGVAKMIRARSEDPKTKVGCVLVKDNRIIGTGYNGFPKHIDFKWDTTKQLYVVHAEANAILNSTEPCEGATAYVTLFPCNECAKLLIQAGIKHIIYLDDSKHDRIETQASREMLSMACVGYSGYRGRNIDIALN